MTLCLFARSKSSTISSWPQDPAPELLGLPNYYGGHEFLSLCVPWRDLSIHFFCLLHAQCAPHHITKQEKTRGHHLCYNRSKNTCTIKPHKTCMVDEMWWTQIYTDLPSGKKRRIVKGILRSRSSFIAICHANRSWSHTMQWKLCWKWISQIAENI